MVDAMLYRVVRLQFRLQTRFRPMSAFGGKADIAKLGLDVR